jgi:hypothetical protein
MFAVMNGHIPLQWKPPCPDWQVGERPALVLMMLDSMAAY